MGLNTWAAFTGADADAMVAGDVAMLETEVTPVLKALRANGLEIVAIHHHMTGVTPGRRSASTTTARDRPRSWRRVCVPLSMCSGRRRTAVSVLTIAMRARCENGGGE